MKTTLMVALVGLACTAHRGSLTAEELAAARAAGISVVETADCGAALHTVANGCAVELGRAARGMFADSWFTIRCPELRDVCGLDYDCTCRPRVRSAKRHEPRPQDVDPLADPFHATRLVSSEPTISAYDGDCYASLYAGPRDCFVSGARESNRGTLIDGKRILVTDTGSRAPFEYWLTCGENTNLCGKPATCACSTE